MVISCSVLIIHCITWMATQLQLLRLWDYTQSIAIEVKWFRLYYFNINICRFKQWISFVLYMHYFLSSNFSVHPTTAVLSPSYDNFWEKYIIIMTTIFKRKHAWISYAQHLQHISLYTHHSINLNYEENHFPISSYFKKTFFASRCATVGCFYFWTYFYSADR